MIANAGQWEWIDTGRPEVCCGTHPDGKSLLVAHGQTGLPAGAMQARHDQRPALAGRFGREVARRPGHYQVFLETPRVTAELTATARCGFHRYTFPASDQSHFILDLVQSMLVKYPQMGQHTLPIWPLWANETWCMIGYHSVDMIAAAYLEGFHGFNAETACQDMRATAMQDRRGLGAYRKLGYVPATVKPGGRATSKTLEYAFDDWCVARMAQALNHKQDARRFYRRSANYSVSPDSGVFVSGSPVVTRAIIYLSRYKYHGHTFTVIAKHNNPQNIYVQSATLNGKPRLKPWFTFKQLAAGGTLQLVMGPKANRAWGGAPVDAPPPTMPAGFEYPAAPPPSSSLHNWMRLF